MNLTQIIFNKENIHNIYIDYESALMPRINFENDELQKIYNENQDKILQRVEEFITEYINDEELCCDDDEFFPKPKHLTGEWYVASINMTKQYLSICTHLLGNDTGKTDDYLGLEVSFFLNTEKNIWEFSGIDSEAL